MKALFLKGIRNVEYSDIPKPTCPDDGLLIKVDTAGLCGSDIRLYNSGSSSLQYPVILGHEIAGIIEEVGKSVVYEWKIGDRVIANPTVPCGKCFYCVNNMYDLCDYLEIAGNSFPGAFAQYMVLPRSMVERGQIIKIADGCELEPMVLVELLASVIKAQNDLHINIGETVVIIGSGPIGCLHAQIAKLHGAMRIIMADINGERLDKCRGFGGTHFIVSSKENLVSRVLDITGGHGADAVIVACPAKEPHQQGLEMLRKEGRLSIFGGLAKDNSYSTMDANLIHYKRLKVLGAFTYSMAEFQRGYELISSGKIDTNIITHKFPLREMESGVAAANSGEAIKVLLKPWE